MVDHPSRDRGLFSSDTVHNGLKQCITGILKSARNEVRDIMMQRFRAAYGFPDAPTDACVGKVAKMLEPCENVHESLQNTDLLGYPCGFTHEAYKERSSNPRRWS